MAGPNAGATQTSASNSSPTRGLLASLWCAQIIETPTQLEAPELLEPEPNVQVN